MLPSSIQNFRNFGISNLKCGVAISPKLAFAVMDALQVWEIS
jgi:hypothetical protein